MTHPLSKLANVMRKGAQTTIRAEGSYAIEKDDTHDDCTCAVGACVVGTGLSVRHVTTLATLEIVETLKKAVDVNIMYIIDIKLIPEFESERYAKHVCLLNAITFLNDTAHWTREAIANWLDREDVQASYDRGEVW